MKNINFDKAIEYANVDNLLLKKRNNGMHLSDFQIDMSSLNAISSLKNKIQEEEKQEDTNYYRKIISEKAQKEIVLKEDILKVN